MKNGVYSENKRKQLIKEIQTDLDDINYMNKNVVIAYFTDEEIQEIYSKLSKVWLVFSGHYPDSD